MFQPTHLLVSRTRKTPVQLVSSENGMRLLTEPEFQSGAEAAFEIRPRLGIFCKGVPLVGYQLQPMPATVPASPTTPTTSQFR